VASLGLGRKKRQAGAQLIRPFIDARQHGWHGFEHAFRRALV
jgi:hypothetical protein